MTAPVPRRLALRLFALLLVFGGSFSLITPPFQVPDEPQHFFRAFEISEARLVPISRDGQSGDVLPASLPRVAGRLIGDAPFHADVRISPAAVRSAADDRIDPANRVFVPFMTAAYSFVPYLPQALGIAAARLFSDRVLALFYAGRIASAIASALLFATAVAVAPVCRPVLFLLASAPMTVFLAASHSADAFTNAFCFLFTAVVVRYAFSDGDRLTMRAGAGLAVLAAVLGLTKPGYVPLAGLFLLVPPRRVGSAARRNAFTVLLLAAGAASAAAWSLAIRRVYPPFQGANGLDPRAQIHALLAHPLDTAVTMAGFYVRHAAVLANQYVGKLGWIDTNLPRAFVIVFFASLVAVAATSGEDRVAWTPRQRAILVAVAAACFAWITVLLFLVFTRPGAAEIASVQGRYFIPLGPPAFLALVNARWRIAWEERPAPLTAWATAAQITALVSTALRFYA